MWTKVLNYEDRYALVPLCELQFCGDWFFVSEKTGEVLWDSRKDGYDAEWFIGNPLIRTIELVKDDSVKEGAVYKFTGLYEEDMKGE